MRSITLSRLGLLLFAALFLVSASLKRATADTALQSFSGGFLATSASDQLYGWEFNVLSSVNVTALGVGDNHTTPGLSVSHDVGIYRVSDQALLTSTTVPAGTAGILDAGFRYMTLGSSLLLTPDDYVIVMTMPMLNGDTQSIFNTSVTTAAQIQYVTSRFDGGSTLAFPGGPGSFDKGLFGPNFQFTPASTPEPGSIALLVGMSISGAGFLIRRRRNANEAV